MGTDEIEKFIEEQKQNFVCKVLWDEKEYFQAIKLMGDTVQFFYYKIDGENIVLEDNVNILSKLDELYEMVPNNICYDYPNMQSLDSIRVENVELKKWTRKFASDTLKNCELFTKVYGKNYAKRKMRRLEKIYIEEQTEENNTTGGYQANDNEITLIRKKENNTEDFISEFYNKEEKKQLLLHESIHLILCHKSPVKGEKWTGIKKNIPVFDQKTNGYKRTEIGRGLNEGLTEWITEKCGYKENGGYKPLTNLIREIELAVGPENTMRLGTEKGMRQVFKMSAQERISFMMMADQIYSWQREILKISKLIIPLNEKETLNSQIYSKDMYNEYVKSEDYKKFLIQNRFEHSDESFNKYCEKCIDELSKQIAETKTDFDTILVKEYFNKEIDIALNGNGTISHEDMCKYTELKRLFASERFFSKERPKAAADFVKSFGLLERKYINSIMKKVMLNPDMTTNDLKRYLDELSYETQDGNEKINEFQEMLIKKVVNDRIHEHRQVLGELIQYLYLNNKLDELGAYSVKEIKYTNGEKSYIYLKNGEYFSDNLGYDGKVEVKNQKNLAEYRRLLVYTANINDLPRIASQFERICERAKAIDSNSKIYILNKTIIIDSKIGQHFYKIDENILPASECEDFEIKFREEDKKQDLIPIKNNFIKNLRTKAFNFFEKFNRNNGSEKLEKREGKTRLYQDRRGEWLINNEIKMENIPNMHFSYNKEKNKNKISEKEEEK